MFLNKKGIGALIITLILGFTTGCGTAVKGLNTQPSGNDSQTSASDQGSSKTSTGQTDKAETDTQTSSDTSASDTASSSSGTTASNRSNGTQSTTTQEKTTSNSQTSSTQTKVAPPSASVMGNVTAVRLINSTSGWLGGNGWIARTDNRGKNWNVQYVGSQTVQQIFALNTNEAWVSLGSAENQSQASLLHTTDGGKHWTPVGKVPVAQAFFHFLTNKEAFAANYYTENGGKMWSSLSLPQNSVGQAYFHDRAHGWVVVNENKKIIVKRTVNGGQTWTPVLSRNTVEQANSAVIRSMGQQDAWVEIIGDSGMSQTSYSLFHTEDGGQTWKTVIAHSSAGGGPAPGFLNNTTGIHDAGLGAAPGSIYVVNSKVAYVTGYCAACDQANTIGWTKDGGQTWTTSQMKLTGYAGSLVAMADSDHGWWITQENKGPSVLYTTSDGGAHWIKVNTFKNSKGN